MELTLHREQGEISVTLSASVQGNDGMFWLYGGTHPHIGAVCICSRGCDEQVTIFPGHREDEIVRTLAHQLENIEILTHWVVCAGIHYEQIPKDWIPLIVSLCQDLGEEAANRLRAELAGKEVL